MPTKTAVAAPQARSDSEIARECGADRIMNADTLLYKVVQWRGEYLRRSTGDGPPHWAMQSKELSVGDTARALVLLAAALVAALEAEQA